VPFSLFSNILILSFKVRFLNSNYATLETSNQENTPIVGVLSVALLMVAAAVKYLSVEYCLWVTEKLGLKPHHKGQLYIYKIILSAIFHDKIYR
jgi:hypothetical protein